ncbi:MAG: hypothetical protein QW404_00500 [Candidatus Nanoarchaeia archaeon]
MRSLENIADELQKVEFNRDANLFHSVIGELLEGVGFSKSYDCYGFIVQTWKQDADGTIYNGESVLHGFDLNQLSFIELFIKSSKFPVKSYSRTANFKREDAFFDVGTFYFNFDNLKKGVYDTRLISSNSKLNTTRPVVDFYVMKREFIFRPDQELLDIVLENDGIMKKGDFYFMNPKVLLDIVSRGPKIFYFNIVENNK